MRIESNCFVTSFDRLKAKCLPILVCATESILKDFCSAILSKTERYRRSVGGNAQPIRVLATATRANYTRYLCDTKQIRKGVDDRRLPRET